MFDKLFIGSIWQVCGHLKKRFYLFSTLIEQLPHRSIRLMLIPFVQYRHLTFISKYHKEVIPAHSSPKLLKSTSVGGSWRLHSLRSNELHYLSMPDRPTLWARFRKSILHSADRARPYIVYRIEITDPENGGMSNGGAKRDWGEEERFQYSVSVLAAKGGRTRLDVGSVGGGCGVWNWML